MRNRFSLCLESRALAATLPLLPAFAVVLISALLGRAIALAGPL